MSNRYTPLHNSSSAPDIEQELNDAFESDDEEGTETTPLHVTRHIHAPITNSRTIPGAYDFERDYDIPPPGSPPGSPTAAYPNNIYGSSNGRAITSPIVLPSRRSPQRSFFRRIAGSVLPTHYEQIETQPRHQRVIGGGTENDGVFANVMAKPQPARVLIDENGEEYMVPEETQKEVPPTYAEAQADAVPPYWETTVHAPAGAHSGDDMIIDDLPTGSFWVFCVNVFISFFFQFVGFLLTYVLHTSHAAKYGSRVGLGLTLIQFGFYSRSFSSDGSSNGQDSGVSWPGDPVPTDGSDAPSPTPSDSGEVLGSITSNDWLSFLLMTLGWFMLLSSLVGYWRVKRWENSIRASTNPAPLTREDLENDIAIRRNLENAFGIAYEETEDQESSNSALIRRDESGHVIVIPAQQMLEEARLARDLRAAGLL